MGKIWLHIIPAILSTFILQIILHELGHLLFGYITGWRLIYLQIYRLAFVRKNRHVLIKGLNTRCCQCIMYPINISNTAVYYTLGGGFANLLGALTGIIVMILSVKLSVLWVYAWSFSASGILLAFVNLIPNTKRICNDGASVKLLNSDKITRNVHNNQMLIAKYLFRGFTYLEMKDYLTIQTVDKADNDILAYQVILELYGIIEADEYERMQQVIRKIEINSTISQNIKDIIFMENLYMDMYLKIKGKDKARPGIRVYNQIWDYIKSLGTEGDVHNIRIKAVARAYETYLEGNQVTAEHQLNDAILRIESMNCVYLGEKRFCVQQLKKIREFMIAEEK